jgi:hypothetical protein
MRFIEELCMFASKKLGFTLVLGSLLAACSSAPKKPSNEDTVAAAVVVSPESSELDLEKLAKERAAQGLTAQKR